MRQFIFAAIGAAAVSVFCAQGASASDMPVKARGVDPLYNWTGWYVGGNLGFAQGNADVTSTLIPGPAIAGTGAVYGAANSALVNALGTGSLGRSGRFTGGGQIGYNWRVAPSWLTGVEADLNFLNQNLSLGGTGAATNGTVTVTNTVNTNWLATVRGRLGMTFDRMLVYVTGGAAFTDAKYTQSFNVPAGVSQSSGTSAVKSILGWAVGSGGEWALVDAWTVKAEYLFAQFGGQNTTTLICSPGCAAASQNLTGSTSHLNMHIARIGLNFRFGER